MAVNVAEFISVLRRIRDEIYPEVEVTYQNALILKNYISEKNITLTQMVADFNTDYDDFIDKYGLIGTYLSQAANSATSSANSATNSANSAATATLRANEIKNISTQTNTGAAGTSADVIYNPTDGKLTFTIPRGEKGDRGDSFTVGAVGTTTGRAVYDGYSQGFSYLNIETSTMYFKLSETSGNWSAGVPFGKGDKGDIGETGIGVTSFTFRTTTDASGLAGQLNALDTYRITLSNGNTFDYVVKNGNSLDIVNNLTSTDITKPLSANQGKVLKGLIDAINQLLTSNDTSLDQLQEIVNYIKQNKTVLDTLSISNIAGLVSALAGKLGVNDTAANASKLNGQIWNWSGQGGQPAWLWGGTDGTNMYVYNPTNFSVNYANSSSYANSAGSANSISTAVAINAIAGANTGEIGTYAMLRHVPSTDAQPGYITSGSSLNYYNATNTGALGANPTGTWRMMGKASGANQGTVNIWLRIS